MARTLDVWEEDCEHSLKDFSPSKTDAAVRQKDGDGQGGAHTGQGVPTGPAGILKSSCKHFDCEIAGFGIGHPWTCSSGRCRDLAPVWIQPRLPLAWADDHGGLGDLRNASKSAAHPKPR